VKSDSRGSRSRSRPHLPQRRSPRSSPSLKKKSENGGIIEEKNDEVKGRKRGGKGKGEAAEGEKEMEKENQVRGGVN